MFYSNGIKKFNERIKFSNPMCVDIEIASICDLDARTVLENILLLLTK